MFLVAPGADDVGVPGLVAAGAAVDGEILAADSFSLSPTMIRSVLRPLRVLISATVVPWAVAIFDKVSPVLMT